MSLARGVINEKAYRKLLSKALPRVIESEEENERFIAVLEALDSRENLSPEEKALAELLTLLIEEFEERHYQLKSAGPLDIIRELMAANGLKQSDLTGIFKTKSIVSAVLSGKRELSREHIQGLSQRFHVSPQVFFPPLSLK